MDLQRRDVVQRVAIVATVAEVTRSTRSVGQRLERHHMLPTAGSNVTS